MDSPITNLTLSSFGFSIQNITLCICLYLDPKSLVTARLISRDWQQAVEFAWKLLEKNYNIEYLCFGRRHNISKHEQIMRAWPYEHDEIIRSQRLTGILTFGGIFGTSRRICRQMTITSESFPHYSSSGVSAATTLSTILLPEVFSQPIGASAYCQDSNGTHLFLGGWDDDIGVINESGLFRGNALSFNPHLGTMELSTIHPPILSCYASAACSIEGHMYYFGGSSTPYQGSTVWDSVFVKKYDFPASDEVIEGYPDDDIAADEAVAVSLSQHSEESWETIEDNLYYGWIQCPGMRSRRCGHSSVTCLDDSMIVLGGYTGGTTYLSSAERYDPVREQWVPLPNMATVRSGAGAVLGPYGGVYVTGGSIDGTIGVAATEMIDIREGVWHALSPLNKHRGYVASCMGRACQWYVSGGLHCQALVGSMEVMDMRTNTWRVLNADEQGGSMQDNLNRACHQMILLI